MAAQTEISWAYGTFNPWIGCDKVSPGCANCYAEAQDKHRSWTSEGWGKGKPRKRTSVAYWRDPLRWNAAAATAGERRRIFSASLADWLDPEVPREWQSDFLRLVMVTPSLDWLLLSKRIHLFAPVLFGALNVAVEREDHELAGFIREWIRGTPPPNVWLGTSVESQEVSDRVHELIRTPARVRWLSVEPLIAPLTLSRIRVDENLLDALDGTYTHSNGGFVADYIDWVVVGGESGHSARPMNPAWVDTIRRECKEHGTAFHFKQWGEWMPLEVGKAREAWGYEIPCPALHHVFADGNDVVKVGKKDAGRALLVNGELEIFDEFPEVRS